MKIWKKILVILFASVCGILAPSYVYNYPIRLWATAPKSVDVLYEAGSKPDNIVLGPTGDMKTTVGIAWRTSGSVNDGVVQFARLDSGTPLHYEEQQAGRKVLYSRELKSNNTAHCYSATITGLAPGAVYRYRVGSRSRNAWSDYHTFSTAHADSDAFTFVYFGDTQAYPERFGKMLGDVEERHPETAFYMIGGDLVEKGDRRNLWDDLFASTVCVFSYKPIVPAMGNHDFSKRGAGENTFSAYFALPAPGNSSSRSDLSYSFQYGNVYFIVVNAHQKSLGEQTAWLEAELRKAAAAKCDFKVLMCHFPIYNTKKSRPIPASREHWAPLLDKYGVDLMLSGHDHSYMRSKPLRAGKAVPDGQPGTTYVVATACEKFYEAEKLEIAAKQVSNIATYQLITVAPGADGVPLLSYKACNQSGDTLDEFELRK